MPAKRIAIIGVGLIGGSLGMALKTGAKGLYRVTGIGRDEKRLRLARQRGAIDEYFTDPSEGVRDADIVVICTPVDLIASTVKNILPHLKPGAILTDVGSVKAGVVKDVRKVLPRKPWPQSPVFVGGHPMAGLEKNGVAHALAGLYEGATVVLTPEEKGTPAAALNAVRTMWKRAGGKVVLMDPREHDRTVAHTSHLPHILAFGLCQAVERLSGKNPAVRGIVAGSFRDLTRVADSNPRDWAAICGGNRELARVIDEFVTHLRAVRRELASAAALERRFTAGRIARNALFEKKR